jgi:hypothetical protein
MKTRTLLVVSAVFWCGLAFSYGNVTVLAVLAVGHALMWHLHRLEVKLNRLLDDRALYVSEADMSE